MALYGTSDGIHLLVFSDAEITPAMITGVGNVSMTAYVSNAREISEIKDKIEWADVIAVVPFVSSNVFLYFQLINTRKPVIIPVMNIECEDFSIEVVTYKEDPLTYTKHHFIKWKRLTYLDFGWDEANWSPIPSKDKLKEILENEKPENVITQDGNVPEKTPIPSNPSAIYLSEENPDNEDIPIPDNWIDNMGQGYDQVNCSVDNMPPDQAITVVDIQSVNDGSLTYTI